MEPAGMPTPIGVDTLVYARLSLYISPGVDLEVSSGYQFIDKPDTYFPKRVGPAPDGEGAEMRRCRRRCTTLREGVWPIRER